MKLTSKKASLLPATDHNNDPMDAGENNVICQRNLGVNNNSFK